MQERLYVTSNMPLEFEPGTEISTNNPPFPQWHLTLTPDLHSGSILMEDIWWGGAPPEGEFLIPIILRGTGNLLCTWIPE